MLLAKNTLTIVFLGFARYNRSVLRIPDTHPDFSHEWLLYCVRKYGRDKVYLSQDENKTQYIVIELEEYENKPFIVQERVFNTQSLSPSELESIPF